MKTTKKKKVVSRHEKIELAIETMRQATRQFEETGYGLSSEDIGPLYVAYNYADDKLHVSARDLEDGWTLSFEDLTNKLVNSLIRSDDDYDDAADFSKLLTENLRKAADEIERRIKNFFN